MDGDGSVATGWGPPGQKKKEKKGKIREEATPTSMSASLFARRHRRWRPKNMTLGFGVVAVVVVAVVAVVAVWFSSPRKKRSNLFSKGQFEKKNLFINANNRLAKDGPVTQFFIEI